MSRRKDGMDHSILFLILLYGGESKSWKLQIDTEIRRGSVTRKNRCGNEEESRVNTYYNNWERNNFSCGWWSETNLIGQEGDKEGENRGKRKVGRLMCNVIISGIEN